MAVREVQTAVENNVAPGQRQALQHGVLATHQHDHVLVDVVELREVVGLALLVGWRLADRSLASEVPSGREVQVQRLDARDEHEAIDGGLVVRVKAIAGVFDHAEAPVRGHAAEAKLANRRKELAPHAFDPDRIRRRVLTRRGRLHRLVEDAHRGVARRRRPRVAAVHRWIVGVAAGRGAEHLVVEQIDLRKDAEVVADVQLGVEAEADVGARLGLVPADFRILWIVAANHQRVRLDLTVVPAGVGMVRRSGPERGLVGIGAAQREVVQQLSAHTEVAVQLEDRARHVPPILGEDLIRAFGNDARCSRVGWSVLRLGGGCCNAPNARGAQRTRRDQRGARFVRRCGVQRLFRIRGRRRWLAGVGIGGFGRLFARRAAGCPRGLGLSRGSSRKQEHRGDGNGGTTDVLHERKSPPGD